VHGRPDEDAALAPLGGRAAEVVDADADLAAADALHRRVLHEHERRAGGEHDDAERQQHPAQTGPGLVGDDARLEAATVCRLAPGTPSREPALHRFQPHPEPLEHDPSPRCRGTVAA
jgi:hypothetical protein